MGKLCRPRSDCSEEQSDLGLHSLQLPLLFSDCGTILFEFYVEKQLFRCLNILEFYGVLYLICLMKHLLLTVPYKAYVRILLIFAV